MSKDLVAAPADLPHKQLNPFKLKFPKRKGDDILGQMVKGTIQFIGVHSEEFLMGKCAHFKGEAFITGQSLIRSFKPFENHSEMIKTYLAQEETV